MRSRYAIAAFTTLLGALPGGPAATQEPVVEAGAPCPAESRTVGDLGYTRLSCNCSLFLSDEGATLERWQFNSEPRIEGVRRGGPADGKLQVGDVVVAIEGQLITTAEAGRRFAQVVPGQPVTLTVRRDGRERTLEITPDADCRPEMAGAAAVRLAPPPRLATPAPTTRPPRVIVETLRPVAQPAVPPVAAMLPRGWLGFSVRCSQCGISQNDRDTTPVWDFTSPPAIERVEPGSPADRAGLRAGDLITAIDGHAITSEAGGAAFGGVRPGQQITVGVMRDGAARTVSLTATGRPVPAATPAPRQARGVAVPRPDVEVQRFTGVIGDAVVEVSGGPITVHRTENEIVIRSADITVRIRRAEPER